MASELKPLGNRVVVKREQPKDKTDGGLHLPDMAKKPTTRGVVIAVGPGKIEHYPGGGQRTPIAVKTGDVVLFTAYVGNEVEIDGEKLIVLAEDEILAIIKEK